MSSLYRTITRQSLHYFARPKAGMPRQALDVPADWSGEQLRSNEGLWSYRFSTSELAEIEAALAFAQASGLPTEQLNASHFPLPDLGFKLAAWRQQIQHGLGFVRLRGLPVDQWTPIQSEKVFWCLGWHLGLPGAQNRQGDLLGHVRDTGQDPNDWRVREYATSVGISFHCDAADAVGLMCLQPAQAGGKSRIASSVAIFNRLLQQQPELVGRLFEPMQLDARGESGLQHFPITPACFDGGQLRTFYHSGYFRSATRYQDVPELDQRTLAVLDAFDAFANDPAMHLEMTLEPGDIQLCSNHSIVHSRTPYTDFAEPQRRRHLLRLWLSFPLQESARNRLRRARSLAALIGVMLRERWRQRSAFKEAA